MAGSCSQRAVTSITWPSIRPTIGCTATGSPVVLTSSVGARTEAAQQAGLDHHLARAARDGVSAVDDSDVRPGELLDHAARKRVMRAAEDDHIHTVGDL